LRESWNCSIGFRGISLALLLLLSACGSGSGGAALSASVAIAPGPPAAGSWILPLDPKFWHQHYNSATDPNVYFAVAAQMKRIADGLSEVFPTGAEGIRFNYLVFRQNDTDITRFSSVTLSIRVEVVSGNPVFEWRSPTNDCKVACAPAAAHLMLWGPPGDLFSVEDRWFADSSIVMAPGTGTMTVSLDPSHWFGVNGQSATKDPHFKETLQHLAALAVTFGGGFFQGHGLNTSGGKAEFDLLQYELD
jgi:hypothetical protein